MKKNYLFLAAAATMFTACVQTDVVNDIPEPQQQAISFDAFANKATRAENGIDLTELKKNGFNVWGYKFKGDNIVWEDDNSTPDVNEKDCYTVFNGVNVSWKEASNDVVAHWGYEDTKYWDRTSTYNFYAAAPAQPTGVTYGITNGMITISGAAYAKSTVSHDFLIDRDGCPNVDGNYTDTHAAVDLDFHHIMSKLSFKLKRAVAENIKVTKLTMTGWNSGKGNFTQILTAKPNVATHTEEWTIPTTDEGSVTLVGDDAKDTDITLNTDNTVDVQDMYIMVPQTIAANTLTFTIDFEIEGETFTAQVGKLTEKQVWGTDTHTTYTISVGPDVIDFNVTNVCNWDACIPDSSL